MSTKRKFSCVCRDFGATKVCALRGKACRCAPAYEDCRPHTPARRDGDGTLYMSLRVKIPSRYP